MGKRNCEGADLGKLKKVDKKIVKLEIWGDFPTLSTLLSISEPHVVQTLHVLKRYHQLIKVKAY